MTDTLIELEISGKKFVVIQGPQDSSRKTLKPYRRCGVYLVYNSIAKQCYTGSGASAFSRFNRHRRRLSLGKHKNPKLQNAWNEYGKEAFEYHIAEWCDEETMRDREDEWIERTDSYNNGYNQTPRATDIGHVWRRRIEKRERLLSGVIPGNEFGKWIVIGVRSEGKVLCRCSCWKKTEKLVDIYDLASGFSKSCGCAKGRRAQIKVGEKYGRLTVLEVRPLIKNENGIYAPTITCKCDCGNIKESYSNQIIGGNTSSCGCLAKDTAIGNKRAQKHGFHGTAVYNCWRVMVKQCCLPTFKKYSEYGARGVLVCSNLKNTPESIINAIGPKLSDMSALRRFPIKDGNFTCGQCDECIQNGWNLNICWQNKYIDRKRNKTQ